MTWKPLAVIVALLVLAAGCGFAGSATATAKLLPGEHCADLLASALSSPDAPVAGAFACQSPALQMAAAASGVTDDASIETFAHGLGYTSASDIGAAPNCFTFLMSGSTPTVLVIWTDASGHAEAFTRAIHP